MRYLGTGWLIGPNHVITNHHVIDARSPGEADAGVADFRLQALGATVEFDYDDLALPTVEYGVAELVANDRRLDFAVLKLAPGGPPLDRKPLPLVGAPIVLDPKQVLPVNIIQHPGGETKQIAIRNNAVAQIDGIDLAYFTDTNGGSSGSPVCNDRWQVLALHKAAVKHKTAFQFQGRDTVWVNVGTPIELIVAQLETLGKWAEIGATVV